MKKVFIVQPMFGKSKNQILKEREIITLKLKEYKVLNSFIEEENNNPIYLLGKSLEILSQADYIYLMKDWEKGRGCRIEKLTADTYNIPIIEEDNLNGAN